MAISKKRDGSLGTKPMLRGCTRLFAGLLAASCGTFAADLASEWPSPGHDFALTRFADLDQVRPDNVANLKLAFSISTGVEKGQEAAPIVVGDTMYVVTPYPNYLFALDLAKPGANVKWKFDPKPAASAQGVACCDVVNRGVAVADGRVFMNTLDGQTIAVEASTGRELWRTKPG
ncbi:MAG TPA: PQQ-binding-like beta-propeller repeat protein, partial [Polyangiaceae bacterium]